MDEFAHRLVHSTSYCTALSRKKSVKPA